MYLIFSRKNKNVCVYQHIGSGVSSISCEISKFFYGKISVRKGEGGRGPFGDQTKDKVIKMEKVLQK